MSNWIRNSCLSVFLPTNPPPDRSRTTSSPTVTPSPGCCLQQPADPRPEGPDRAPPLEFAPLRRLSPDESTIPWLASPGAFRPQGFPPSRRLAPRSDLPALFHAGNAPGVCPSGVFPHHRVPELVAPGFPHDVCSPTHLRKGRLGAPTLPRGSTRVFAAFRALLRQRIRAIQLEMSPAFGRSPPGLFLSRVLPECCAAATSATPLMRLIPRASRPAGAGRFALGVRFSVFLADPVPFSLEMSIPL